MGACTLVLLTLSVVTGLIYFYLSWNFNFWKKRGVKGPEPRLIYGSVPNIVKRKRHMAFDMQDLYEKYKNTGERFIGIFMTRNPQILVIDPKLARDIMVTNFKVFRDNEPSLWVNRKIEKVSGKNPFLTFGSDWKETRTDVVGGLSASKIKQAYPIVIDICKKLTKCIKVSTNKSEKTIEIKDLCYKYTMEIIADFVWGLNANTLSADESPNHMLNMSRKMLDMSFLRVGFFYLSGLAPFVQTVMNGRFFPEETDNFFSQVQKDALELRLRNMNERQDFLNYLIQLQEKKNISHWDMVGHSLTVLLDGFETSASVMMHTLYYLAGNENAQKKLREEIMANLDQDGCLSYDTLIDLPYLDQCINETIRMITPIAVFSRICSEKTYLENHENHQVAIEPGMILHIPTYAFHHDQEIFPDPEDYIPERFDGGRAKELTQKGCFFPFGDGPRICAGMRLGQLECKAGVTEILKNFHIKKGRSFSEFIDPAAFIIGLSGDIFLDFESI